ncbi:MAG TPA: hypothetical protein VF615_19985 [Longimicrobiaceae bacterium]
MKKLTLHRETLRLVSFRAPTRDKGVEGTAAASPGINFSADPSCFPEPVSASSC